MSKKIQLMRASGMPVSIENLKLFKDEWREEFHKLEKKHGKDMLGLAKDADELETSLKKKYPNVVHIPFLKTKKAIKEAIKQYQNPITIAINQIDGELVYVIMDVNFDTATYSDL